MENIMLLLNICSNSGIKHSLVILGWVLLCIKILVPAILIIIGIKDLAKAVIEDSDNYSGAVKLFIVKFIIGAAIFFVPTLIDYVFTDMVSVSNNFSGCVDCFFNPSDCYKKVLVQKEKEEKEKEDKWKEMQEEEKNKDDGQDNNTGNDDSNENIAYHTNSINGIRYQLYNQNDSRWANVGTIGKNGCHIVSAAVIASAYDSSITPKTVHSKHTQSYPYTVVNDMAGEAFSCKHISASTSKSDIIAQLSKGNVMVIMVYGKGKGGSSNFTGSQHYISLIDYQDGKIFVGNSYGTGTGSYNRNGWFDADVVLTSIREINLCEPKNEFFNKNQPEENIQLSYSFNDRSTMRYALYSPEGGSKTSNVPLIVWLHGSGEVNASESTFKSSGLLAVLNNWSLDGFNAYVLCPISTGSWANARSSLYDLINKIVQEKNINTNKIILVGHSMGAIGVFSIANGNVNYFSSYVVLSGYNSGVDLNQFKNSNIKIYVGHPSYGEDSTSYNYTMGTLNNVFGASRIEVLNTSHGGLPKTVFNLDQNKDNKSDLIEWMISN